MKKRIHLFMLICSMFLCLVISGCGKKAEKYDYKIFYLSSDEKQLVTEGYNAKSNDINDLVDELLGVMNEVPGDIEGKVPGLDMVKILDWSCSADGFITINFNADYNKLPVIKEILCRAAIVKTLCQINGIQGVEFMVEGEKYMDSDGVEYGIMTSENFVDNTSGETTYKQTISVSLYFASKKGDKLVKLPVNLTFDGTISMEQLIVMQLIKGPQVISGASGKLKAPIPKNTTINQITVREKICYIDLSKDFLNLVPGVSREATLYSIVNSLVELPYINNVQFSIEGDTVRYFGDSSIPFDVPLERNLEIVKE